jgi:hypothetical protein
MAPLRTLFHGLSLYLVAQVAYVDAQVAEIEKASNESLLWGPYRPNLYFGVRPRIPKSLMGGLLWTRVEDYASVQTSKCPLSRPPRNKLQLVLLSLHPGRVNERQLLTVGRLQTYVRTTRA